MMKKFLLLLLLAPAMLSAETSVSGTISSDVTWTASEGPYILNNIVTISASSTLTIEPGAVVKGRHGGAGKLDVLGALIAKGTSEQPIYLTSLLDDKAGGDTDATGITTGVVGDWRGISFQPGSMGNLDHVVVRYSGYTGAGCRCGVENDGGTVTIKNSLIDQNNQNGVWQKNGILVIEDSILSNHLFGITISSGTTMAASNTFASNSTYGLFVSSGDSLTLNNNNFIGNGKTAHLAASLDFSHTGNTSSDITNRGFEINGLVGENAVWHTNDLPLIVTAGAILWVSAGHTLTIEPGSIIKFGTSAATIVEGNLISKGTEVSKIYLTSLTDDSLGGDTNGDGSASLPGPTDWKGIQFWDGSAGEMSHANIRYSGRFNSPHHAAIFNLGGDVLLDEITFSNNFRNDIYQDTGSTTVAYSLFSTSTDYAIYNVGTTTVDARLNWWGSDTGPTHSANAAGDGARVSDNVLFDPWLIAPPGATPPELRTLDPVIIIPGIMGSAYKNGQLVIDPILHTYDDLIATLVANGYVQGVDLFTFPYEWRDSNVLTAAFLRNKINQIKETCECEKVDIVAHSMGGLVARQYIQSSHYAGDVDQLIFLGTPHRGGLDSYLAWEAGEFQSGFFNQLKKALIYAESKKNGFINIFDYIRNRPIKSVEELLPVSSYLKDKDMGIIREYPSNYPRNLFLENLNTNISNLFDKNIETTNIIGNSGNNTIEIIRVVPSSDPGLWVHGQPDESGSSEDNGLEKGPGDDTVTINNASLDISVPNITKTSTHRALVSDSSAIIYKTFTGKNATTVIDDKRFPDIRVVLFQLLSPIDILITAPNGKKIGKNFDTSEEYDEIPLAFYSGVETDDEYITILNPLDGEYKVEIQGTDNGGKYGVLTSYISDEISVTKETSGLTEPGQITTLNVGIDNGNPENIESEKVVTLEVLLNDIIKAYELGWITDKKLKDRLVKQVKAIIKIEAKIEKIENKNKKNKDKKIEKLELKIDKKLAKALLVELKAYKKDRINEQAYNIIKEDLEWLINN